MKLYIAYLKDNTRLVFKSTDEWVGLHCEDGSIIASDSENEYLNYAELQEIWDGDEKDWQDMSLLPKQVSPGMLDSIAIAFNVNQYCIGCGEWFSQDEMTKGDGNELDGYDWYCNVCSLLYSPTNPPWGGLKGV